MYNNFHDINNFILAGVLNPISSVYSAIDNAIYWINAGQDLMKYDLDTGNKTRVLCRSFCLHV